MDQAPNNHLMIADENGAKLDSFTKSQTNNIISSNHNNNGSSASSSTRWTPTTEQIKILKELYYNNGVRSPSADQIQRISARLRQYGKIEGKNVFYWFQNHKARERQKKRFNTTNNNPSLVPIPPASVWISSDSSVPYVHSAAASKYPNISQHLIYTNGHNQMTRFGYGSVTMEKSFRDCSISAGGSPMGHSFGWARGDLELDHHFLHNSYAYTSPYHALHGRRKSINNDEYRDILLASAETLPLFPMHGEDLDSNYSFCHVNSSENDEWFRHDDVGCGGGGARASLELSLNSYAAMDQI